MSIHRFIVASSLFLSAWLAASFLYATPRELVRAFEAKKKGETHVATQPDLVDRERRQSSND